MNEIDDMIDEWSPYFKALTTLVPRATDQNAKGTSALAKAETEQEGRIPLIMACQSCTRYMLGRFENSARSPTFSNMRKRHSRRGVGIGRWDGRRRPTVKEGKQFIKDVWQSGWSQTGSGHDCYEEFIPSFLAGFYLRERDVKSIYADKFLKDYIEDSDTSPAFYNALLLIYRELAETEDPQIPPLLSKWIREILEGNRERPAEGTRPPGAPRRMDTLVRHFRIKILIDVLVSVGMRRSKAYRAMGEALSTCEETIKSIDQRRGWSDVRAAIKAAVERVGPKHAP